MENFDERISLIESLKAIILRSCFTEDLEDLKHLSFDNLNSEHIFRIINFQDENMSGETFLHKATSAENRKFIKYFLNNFKEYIDVNIQTTAGRTALHYAAKNNNLAIARLLLEYPSSNLEIKDSQGLNALDYACTLKEEYAEEKYPVGDRRANNQEMINRLITQTVLNRKHIIDPIITDKNPNEENMELTGTAEESDF